MSEGFYQDIITHGSGVSMTPLKHACCCTAPAESHSDKSLQFGQ